MYGAGDARSTIVALMCGVPQGSVFGPILFIMYTVDLVSVTESHGLSSHMYADDTEVYGSCRPAAIDDFSLRISACVGDALVCLHWLRVPERVQFKIFILTYKVLHLLTPQHLGPLNRVADLPGHRSLRSTDFNCMVVPSVRLSTVANRAFPVVGPQIWNDLPAEVTSAESLTTFRQRLKTHLFSKSFPGYLLDIK